MKELSEHFEIIVFTASHECYGNVVANYLDPTGKLIAARYYRDSCFKTSEGFYVKDLRVIDRSLENILLIDNVIIVLFRQPTATLSKYRTACQSFLFTTARMISSFGT